MNASRQLQAGSLRQRTPSAGRSRLSAGVSPLPLSHNEEIDRPRARGRSTNFVPQEDAYLSRAYVNASCDPRIGNNQKGEEFWRKVGQGYIILCVGTEFESRIRTTQQLYIRFNKHIKVDLVVFNRYYLRVMQRQPSGVPQTQYTDMAAELYREGEGKAFRFKLCVPILHEVPKYCPFYNSGDTASELQPNLAADSDSDPDDDDNLEEPHEILSTGEEPPEEEDHEEQDHDGVGVAVNSGGRSAAGPVLRRASTSSTSSSSGNIRNTIGTVMGSRLKRPIGCKAAKAEKAKAMHAMATANAVKQMATNVASLVASYDRKNENEMKRVKMEETRSAVAMYMGMGMAQEAQEWAARFVEDLTCYRQQAPQPPPPPSADERATETEAATAREPSQVSGGASSSARGRNSSTGVTATARGGRNAMPTNRNSSSTNSRGRRGTSSSATNRHSVSNNSHNSLPNRAASPNLLADDSSEETDVLLGQLEGTPGGNRAVSTSHANHPPRRVIPSALSPPAPTARNGSTRPGAVAASAFPVPNEVRVTPGDDDTGTFSTGRFPATNNHDWLMGSQLTAHANHQGATTPQGEAGNNAVYEDDDEATQVGRSERRGDEFGTATGESTVIIYGDS